MRIFLWHVHGSWTTGFVQGGHDYLLPVLRDRGPDGRGRALTWDWPPQVVEVTPEEAQGCRPDVVVLQRPGELALCERWLGLRPGTDVAAVYLEHDTPPAPVGPPSRHLLADRGDIRLVHVTHTNACYWDSGRAPVTVIEHGVADPSRRASFELACAAAVINEPVRRGRTVGTDLLEPLSRAAPIDCFGMGTELLDGAPALPGGRPALRGLGNLPQQALHGELARRRVYLHPYRWTSLGLSLIESMMLGLPVVALATTETPRTVPAAAGVVSNDRSELAAALARFVADPVAAAEAGAAARAAALERHGLRRFLADWDEVLGDVMR